MATATEEQQWERLHSHCWMVIFDRDSGETLSSETVIKTLFWPLCALSATLSSSGGGGSSGSGSSNR